MNPLFRNATRALKAQIRAEFRTGQLGRMLTELSQKTLKRGRAGQYMKQIAKRIHGTTSAQRLAALPGWNPGVERYAKKRADKETLEHVFRAFGPLGDILKSFIRPTGKALTGNVERELQAATNLLKAFGFEIIAPPPKRGGQKANIEATTEYLGKLGFKVVPTSTATGFPIKGMAAAPQQKPLPGWAQRAHQIQAKPINPRDDRPPRARKTIDVDFGDGRSRRVKLDDPILTGAMIPVVSSNVHSIGFDINTHSPQIGTLKVRFLQTHGATASGAKVAGPLYEYYNVPTDLFRRFQRAASKGKFVWDNLRMRGTVSGSKYDYSLQGISRGYVPRKATINHEGQIFQKRTFLGEHHKTGEKRLFQSKETALVRPHNGRPGNGRPDNGRPNRGRR